MRVRYAIALLFLIGLPKVLMGQGILHYEGPYKIGPFVGDASFDFDMVDGDTLLNGPFQMQQSELNKLLTKGDEFFFCKGQFSKGQAVGRWNFQFGDFKAAGATNLDSYQYQVEVEGDLHTAEGSMIEGKPHGNWEHRVEHIKNGQIDKVPFKSVINFSNGIPIQNFRIDNEDYSLIGRFLRDGLAHDIWSLFSNQDATDTESWAFSEGNLQQILISRNSRTDTISEYKNISAPRINVTLDERYINVLKLRQRLKRGSDTLLVSHMKQLLAKNARYYDEVSNVLSDLGNTQFRPEFKVRLNHYPLNDKELEYLTSINKSLGRSNQISSRLLDSPQLNLLRLADSEVAFLFNVVLKLDSIRLRPIRQIVEFEQRGLLEFVDRRDLVQTLLPSIRDQGTLNIEYIYSDSSSTGVFNISQIEATGDEPLYQLNEFANLSLSSLEQIQEQLDEKILRQERQEELRALETQLYAKIKGLNSQVDSLVDISQGPITEAITSLKSTGSNLLKDYSQLDTLSQRIDRANELVPCLKRLTDLSLMIANVPQKKAEIKKEYENSVWNPFTLTVMKEDVKRRIYSTYEQEIIPHFLQSVREDLTCENSQELIGLLTNTHIRMLELRNENTKKIERKLKRQKDIEAIMKLLNIQAVAQSKESDG